MVATMTQVTGKQRQSQAVKATAQYYLQLSYMSYHPQGQRKEQWYWDGSELVPKSYAYKEKARIYHSKSAAQAAAKRLQPHVDRFADTVTSAIGAKLQPVRVTW